MRQYAAWQAPFYSFWSKTFYIDVAKNWHGLAYLYLFVLVCFTWLFMSIKIQMDFSYFADHFIKTLFQQFPVVTIDKGILSIDKPSPYTIKDFNGDSIITFDTSDKPLTPSQASGIFLVTKKTVIFKEAALDQQIIKQGKDPKLSSYQYKKDATKDMDLISTVDHAVIDQSTFDNIITNLKNSLAIIVFVIALPAGFILCVLQSLIYGLFALSVASANQINLSYGTLVRLSSIAMTPVLLIDSLLKMRNLDSPLWGPAALVITAGYIIFAVRSNITEPNQKSQSVNS